MIRRMMETLLEELQIPPDVRETFFPAPPVISSERTPAPPPVAPPPLQAEPEETSRSSRGRYERDVVEGISSRPTTPPPARRLDPERAVRQASVSSTRTARELVGTPAALRQAILAREILGPPRAMQEDDQQRW